MTNAHKQMLDTETSQVVDILTPDDFEGYDYNRPSGDWELVMYPSGQRVWIPQTVLVTIPE
jgi:hypothetical protein